LKKLKEQYYGSRKKFDFLRYCSYHGGEICIFERERILAQSCGRVYYREIMILRDHHLRSNSRFTLSGFGTLSVNEKSRQTITYYSFRTNSPFLLDYNFGTERVGSEAGSFAIHLLVHIIEVNLIH
jgi:hypothetical protein